MSLQLRNCLCDKVICTRERQCGPPQSSPAIAVKRRRMVFFRSLSEQLQRLKLCVFQCRDHELTLKLREYENIAERAGKSLASEDLHSAIAPRH